MSSIEVQQQRKAEAIRDAAQIIERSKPDAERLSVVMEELLIADDDKLAAIVYELAEMAARVDRTVDHISDHILAAQQKEIESLKKRIGELEKGASAEKEIEALDKRVGELEKGAAAEPSEASGATKDS